MEQATLDQVAERARSLTTEEQRRLRDLLDSWLTSSMSVEDREREVLRRLCAKGVIRHIADPAADTGHYERREPVEIAGEPLSRTIIRDRGD